MKTRTRRLLIATITLCLICCTFGGLTAIKVVAWVRDLPNRMVIDGDALASTFGTAVVQSYHEGLINGDTHTCTLGKNLIDVRTDISRNRGSRQ
jgi:hypothetical protein